MRIRATIGGITREEFLEVFVPGLFELNDGTNYVLTGFDTTPRHPVGTNHYGTAVANAGLVTIADDYKNQFYGASAIPQGDKLKYNDQSLLNGGKFDLPGDWCSTCSHFEHRTGINCDVSSNNVPSNRRETLEAIFRLRRSPGFLDETNTSQPHWHLRFQ